MANVFETGAYCRPLDSFMPIAPQVDPLDDPESIKIYADDALIQEHEGISTFRGNVILQRFGQLLTANTIVYARHLDTADAENDFTYWSDQFVVSGEQLQLRPYDQGEMHRAHYWLPAYRGRGFAETVYQDSTEQARLFDSSYTTCDPQREVWTLKAQESRLDLKENVGYSKNVTLRFFNVPVFYTPYLSYPLSGDRKTGFLAPHFGSSNEVGTEFSIPFYWNLNPSYDLTLTPRLMSRRGLLMKSEFRYLTNSMEGSIKAEYLPHDRVSSEDRKLLSLRNQGTLWQGSPWYTDLVYDYTSDERYFEELGYNLTAASTTHLEQRGDLYYMGYGWLGLLRLQRFQTLDRNPLARPYGRLPQLLLQTKLPEFNRQFNVAAHVELARFDRDIEIQPDVTGNRADMKLALSYPLRYASGFFVPQLSARYTHYSLDNEKNPAQTSESRLLYTFSTDAGLFFEREQNLFNHALLHTVEPRIYYRYTPFKEQSELPVFDTAEYDLSFGQLFRDNRYSGADRIDDGHQITLALSSRLLDAQTGQDYVRASLGEIFYLNDPKVTLPNVPILSDSSSSTVAELSAQLSRYWSASGSVRWNRQDENLEYSVWRLRYKRDQAHLFNVAYRFRQSTGLEQTDISGYWPLASPRWRVIGRWNYSLRDRKDIELFAGVEYESCCWAMRGIVRRYLTNIDGDHLNGIFFQIELKGLGGLGRKAEALLETTIPGFEDRF
jgi:LPS-assembly protein